MRRYQSSLNQTTLQTMLASRNRTNGSSEKLEALTQATLPFYEEYQKLKGQKVMVLFSGGLDTSFMAHFLRQIIGADVTTFSANVGSVTEAVNMHQIQKRSEELGVKEHVELDCRHHLSELGLNAIQAEATLGLFGHHPASSLARVAICQGALTFAKENGLTAIMHGSNGSQNNPYRFMSALQYFGRQLNYPIEEYTPNIGKTTVERDMEGAYLEWMGISVKSAAFEKNVSHDRNLLGDEWEEDFIANPKNRYDVRTTALKSIVPGAPRKIGIRFEKGVPTAIQTGEDAAFQEMNLSTILEELNAIGLQHHIGIYDYPEARPIGINAREVHIGPALDILIRSRNWLRAYNLDRKTNNLYNLLSQTWSDLVLQQNLYLCPEREQIDSLLKAASATLNGEVFLTLENGIITNLWSPHADLLMEGKKEAASKEFVINHLQHGADQISKNVIAVCKRLFETNDQAGVKNQNSRVTRDVRN